MTELEQIIQRMIDAGESEENIKIVIQNYQTDQVKQAKQAEPVKTEAVATERFKSLYNSFILFVTAFS